jgi:hypothetical protein
MIVSLAMIPTLGLAHGELQLMPLADKGALP